MSNNGTTTKAIGAAALALPLALLLSACAGGATDTDGAGGAPAERETVKIGVVGAGDPYWETYVDAAAVEGIDVELVDFSEYTQPNPALSAGELDLNQFQHVIYLATYNVQAGDDLVPVGSTAIYPLGLYSTKYDSVDEIPAGETVAVPNDESNQARGLLVLQSAGLIELKDGGSTLSTVADVLDTSKVKVEALDAAFTATSLPDVAAAIINNDFVADAGLSFDDAIATDDPSDPNALPYVNIFAARAEDADNPTYQKLVEIFQGSQDVLDGLQEASGGTAQLVKTPASDLVTSLHDVEEDIRANQ
jgi:D-methionine transport system substrate-binding protein